MCHENCELYFPYREYGTEFRICHSIRTSRLCHLVWKLRLCLCVCVSVKVRERQSGSKCSCILCWECLSLGSGACRQSMMGPRQPKLDADEEPCWIIMYHHRSSTDREGLHNSCFSPDTTPPQSFLPLHPPPLSPVHLSRVSTASRTNSDENFLGTENSLPPCCSVLYLHPLPLASVVCCFHRKLARRPLR